MSKAKRPGLNRLTGEEGVNLRQGTGLRRKLATANRRKKQDKKKAAAVPQCNAMPHNGIFVAYLPGSQENSTVKILGLIESQNGSLNATNWRRASEGPLELLTLSVNHQSAERLRKTGFVINYKFGHTTLRPRSGEPKGQHLISCPNLAPQVSNIV
ncbi:hypothetical protein JTB14_018901 [Gonioctena quinquepunctata]|nr:hypothetical protein JTB14_018901 [Gonioctena quinquepunctata]